MPQKFRQLYALESCASQSKVEIWFRVGQFDVLNQDGRPETNAGGNKT